MLARSLGLSSRKAASPTIGHSSARTDRTRLEQARKALFVTRRDLAGQLLAVDLAISGLDRLHPLEVEAHRGARRVRDRCSLGEPGLIIRDKNGQNRDA